MKRAIPLILASGVGLVVIVCWQHEPAFVAVGGWHDRQTPAVSPIGRMPANVILIEPATARWRCILRNVRRDLTNRPVGEELAGLAEAVPEEDIIDVLDLLDPDELRSDFGIVLFDRWVGRDPKAAAMWAVRHGDKDVRDRMLQTAAAAWAERDLSDALAWIDPLSASAVERETEALLRSVIAYQALEQRPVTAVRLALELELLGDASDRSGALLRQAIDAWSRIDPRSATAWIQRQPPGQLRDRMIAALAVSLSEIDAFGAVRLALESLPPGAVQSETVETIVQHRRGSAADWAATLSDDALDNLAVPAFVALWTARDPQVVRTWLAGLPPGPARNEGVVAYARFVVHERPTEAVRWARSIDDEDMRVATIERLQEAWR